MPALLTLRNIFREIFDDDTLAVTPETSRNDVAGWDSVAQVMLVLAIEEAFDMRFREDEVSSIRSVGDFLEAIEERKAHAA